MRHRTAHGVRVYADSTTLTNDGGVPLYLHGAISQQVSDFFYIFRCMTPVFAGLYFVDEFTRDMADDPDCVLVAASYGKHLVDIDATSQTAILLGSGFPAWGSRRRCAQGVFLPFFNRPPTLEEAKRVFRGSDPCNHVGRWPEHMRGFIHMWDDIYWELYSTVPADVDRLIQAHMRDKHLTLYEVDLAKDYPHPRDVELTPASPSGAHQPSARAPTLTEQSYSITDGVVGRSGWTGISRGDIYLGDVPFGWYIGYRLLDTQPRRSGSADHRAGRDPEREHHEHGYHRGKHYACRPTHRALCQ